MSPPAEVIQPPGKPPRIASLVPAATDLLMSMGAGDHVVAVSTFDNAGRDLPQAGDYENTNWEVLKKVQPKIIVVQAAESRLPFGFKDNTDALGITRLNVHFDQLVDIYSMTHALGDAAQEPGKASELEQKIRTDIDRISVQTHGDPPIRTLIFLDQAAEKVVGPNNFLDELLHVAGGQNVASGLGSSWPTIDREKLLALKPDVIVFLLPGASTEIEAKAMGFGTGLDAIPAVHDGRIYVLSDWYVQMPQVHVGEVASRLFNVLHAAATAESSPGDGWHDGSGRADGGDAGSSEFRNNQSIGDDHISHRQ